MVHKIKRFLQLNSAEKIIFIEAFCTLGIMRALSLIVPFRNLVQSLKQDKPHDIAVLQPKEYVVTLNVREGIKRAVRYTPWKSVCLTQSLAARKMLQKRGVPGVIYLGVKKDSSGNMKAHSWSKCGEIVVTGQVGMDKFTVVSTFVWGKE